MRRGLRFVLCALILAAMQQVLAEGAGLNLRKSVEAGSAFSIKSSGSGEATLYIIGLGQVLERDVHLGETLLISAGSLCKAGHYLVILSKASGVETNFLDVVPAGSPAELSFLAKPSRLPVSQHDGISGATYVFDAYGNLILAPMSVSFELSSPFGAVQKDEAITRNGAAWVEMNSTERQGIDRFVAGAGNISSASIIRQVPGDPCGLKMSAEQSGQQLQLRTAPVLDCSGNSVLDGTIVTFTEAYEGGQSTVDVPLKHGIAEITMPAHSGALLSVASGVALGNQIRWEQ
jgi:hypothetical protein